MSKKPKHITFKVWLEIERYNDKTGRGQDMDAPGSSLAEFDTYEEAWEYAERVTQLAEGRPMKEIANILKVSEKTVMFHKYNIMETFNLKNNTELVLFALKHHLISS